MKTSGELNKAGRTGFSLLCAIALVASGLVTPVRAQDRDDSPTAEIWAKDARVAGPAAVSSPATTTRFSEDTSGELRVMKVVGSSGAAPTNLTETPTERTIAPTTSEIPPMAGFAPAASPTQASGAEPVPPDNAADDSYSPDLSRYEHDQFMGYGPLPGPYFQDQVLFPIGVEVEEAARKFATGEEADGLLVVKVEKGSPAAMAGLRGYSRTGKNIATGMAIAGAMAGLAPLIMAVPLIDSTSMGEKYDLIIAVDGARVSSLLDFQDRLRNLRPGEILYLSLLRDGQRKQVRISLPPLNSVSW